MHIEELPETIELVTFVRVVETGSISRAARELRVPRPTVGRRLARLEARLGVRLLQRSTRAMGITEAGEAFYPEARAALDAMRQAQSAVRERGASMRGTLRISTPPFGAVSVSFAGLIAAFMARHPEVRIEHHASSRHVDLVAEGFDLAVRAGLKIPDGLVGRSIGRSRLLAVAAPAYLRELGAPKGVRDLARHRCLASFTRDERPGHEWPLLRGGTVRIDPVLASNDMVVLREMALAGRGIGVLPALLIDEHVRAGQLVPVLEGRLGAPTQVTVVYPERKLVPPAVRAFVEVLVAWARSEPTLAGASRHTQAS